MSINIEIGGATANSYVSVASADSYFSARVNASSWNDISNNTNATSSTTQKENLLKQATREIDRKLRFQDQKYYDVPLGNDNYQALEFPRTSTLDDDGDRIIPDEVKFATYEQALWLQERGGKRTDANGSVINKQIIGDETLDYINFWIDRQVKPINKYKWQGSDY
jgi:hypothetical protein